ncbi:Metallo-dependent hydrolase, partial [Trametes cingulata]
YLLKGGKVATFVHGEDAPRVYEADVLVEGNTITRIDKNIQREKGVEIIDCTNKWITPGFVDTHRHVFQTVMRASHGKYVVKPSLISSLRIRSVQGSLTPEEVGIGALAGYLDALHNGVTTVLDHFHAAHTPAHAEAALRAAVESGARAIWAPARQSAPTQLLPSMEFAQEAETEKWQREQFREWGENDGNLRPDGRVKLGLSYDISWQGAISGHKEWIDYARANNAHIITAHAGRGPLILSWRDGGLLGPDVLFSHCNGLADQREPDAESWKALKESGAAIGATPVGEVGMSYGNTVAIDASKRGVKAGLGADTTSVNGGDLFTPMRVALQWTRGREHQHAHQNGIKPPLHLPYGPADVFRLATLGGAEALNLAHLIGTVEVGKRADLLVFDADSVNLGGADDPISGVVFHASSEDIEIVFVDGEIVKKEKKLVRDWKPIVRELKERAKAIRARWPEEKQEEVWKAWYEANGPPVF